MKGLTEKQQNILNFMEAFIHREGMAPTVNETAAHFGIKAATVIAHMRALQHKGHINRSSKARSITITRNHRPAQPSPAITIPLLHKIIPGTPLLTEDNLEKSIQIDPALLAMNTGGRQLFGLRVPDDSMSGVGMMSGDIVIAQHAETAFIGDLVVIQAEGREAVIRWFYIHDQLVELRPADDQYQSQYHPPGEVRLHGVVVALHRTFPG